MNTEFTQALDELKKITDLIHRSPPAFLRSADKTTSIIQTLRTIMSHSFNQQLSASSPSTPIHVHTCFRQSLVQVKSLLSIDILENVLKALPSFHEFSTIKRLLTFLKHYTSLISLPYLLASQRLISPDMEQFLNPEASSLTQTKPAKDITTYLEHVLISPNNEGLDILAFLCLMIKESNYPFHIKTLSYAIICTLWRTCPELTIAICQNDHFLKEVIVMPQYINKLGSALTLSPSLVETTPKEDPSDLTFSSNFYVKKERAFRGSRRGRPKAQPGSLSSLNDMNAHNTLRSTRRESDHSAMARGSKVARRGNNGRGNNVRGNMKVVDISNELAAALCKESPILNPAVAVAVFRDYLFILNKLIENTKLIILPLFNNDSCLGDVLENFSIEVATKQGLHYYSKFSETTNTNSNHYKLYHLFNYIRIVKTIRKMRLDILLLHVLTRSHDLVANMYCHRIYANLVLTDVKLQQLGVEDNEVSEEYENIIISNFNRVVEMEPGNLVESRVRKEAICSVLMLMANVCFNNTKNQLFFIGKGLFNKLRILFRENDKVLTFKSLEFVFSLLSPWSSVSQVPGNVQEDETVVMLIDSARVMDVAVNCFSPEVHVQYLQIPFKLLLRFIVINVSDNVGTIFLTLLKSESGSLALKNIFVKLQGEDLPLQLGVVENLVYFFRASYFDDIPDNLIEYTSVFVEAGIVNFLVCCMEQLLWLVCEPSSKNKTVDKNEGFLGKIFGGKIVMVFDLLSLIFRRSLKAVSDFISIQGVKTLMNILERSRTDPNLMSSGINVLVSMSRTEEEISKVTQLLASRFPSELKQLQKMMTKSTK